MRQNLDHFYRNKLFTYALVLGSLFSVAITDVRAAPADARDDAVDISELIAQAEAHRASGRHAEAARGFVEVYDDLDDLEQAGLKGEITVNNAVDCFNLAQAAEPVSIALLAEEAALLERYGRRKGGLPDDLVEELERVDARLVELQRWVDERNDERNAESEQNTVKADTPATRSAKAEIKPPRVGTTNPGSTEPLRMRAAETPPDDQYDKKRRQWIALAVSGYGIALGGLGACYGGIAVRGKGNDALSRKPAAAPGSDRQDAIRQVNTGTGLLIAAPVGVSLGVVLGVFALVGLKKLKSQQETSLRPSFYPGGGGITARVRF